jgi:hypothetical protein
MPKSPKNKKDDVPPQRKSQNGCMRSGSINVEDGLNIGKFRLCVSEDGETLQIWKDGELINTFK